ncbi:MAG: hypothetical protein DSO09_06675 [Candidatus Methanomethylicota archaeon]|uniref:DUF1847 domain-containing protein n=1 Tax=Thermoproteota archaeon TaxID=2056631 RepID=A0A523B9M9_9CREN|nr:MAG: hypothetical protein DSO09_06675 [Candidatus Verstraetearchaeota archaeon]
MRETIEICKRLNIKKIGIAFCIGLDEEVSRLNKIFESYGFNVYSIACKCVDKKLNLKKRIS